MFSVIAIVSLYLCALAAVLRYLGYLRRAARIELQLAQEVWSYAVKPNELDQILQAILINELRARISLYHIGMILVLADWLFSLALALAVTRIA